jgi:transcription elongation GreA/GreB family factor
MRSANTLAQRMAIAIEYLKKSDSSERHPTALTEMALLVEEAAVRTPDQATRLEGAFVIEDLAKAGAAVAEGPIAQPAALLARVTDLPAVINGMTRGDYQRRALRLIREAQPDAWPALYEEILFDSPRELWDFILKELLDAGYGARASDACLRVATDHYKHAELYLWLCRCAFADRFDAALGGHDEFVLFENLLSLLDELADPRREQGAEAKKLLGRGKDVIGMKDFGHLRRIVKECTQDEARRLRDLVAYNRGLSDPTRRAVVAVLQDFHPSIFERVVPKEEELPIYTTPAGLRKVQDEYDKLMSVEMPANQAALGAALGHGDVSDNADLRAAREEQAHLAHRADHLAAQLRRVEVLDRLRVNTGQVSPGTQVLVRDIETDREQTFTVLGPWDADPEQGVISHQASLAQALQGKKIGDVARVELADGSRAFEIVAINRAEW